MQSDPLEGRFRLYRLLCGANYFNSCLSFLQAEKSLRIKALVNDGFNMDGIKAIFKDAEVKKADARKAEVEAFVEMLDHGLKFDAELDDECASIVHYYAGYISRSLLKKEKCNECVKIVASESKSFSSDVIEEEYLAQVTRGGLCKASNLVALTTCHAYEMWLYIRNGNQTLKDFFWKTTNPKSVFIESFKKKVLEIESIASAKCKNDHKFERLIRRIAGALFNCASVNRAKELNDEIHKSKKRKAKKAASTNQRKLIKLTSGTSTTTTVTPTVIVTPTPVSTPTTNPTAIVTTATPAEDCGQCKYCKDKKKFGGPGKLKRKCVNK